MLEILRNFLLVTVPATMRGDTLFLFSLWHIGNWSSGEGRMLMPHELSFSIQYLNA